MNFAQRFLRNRLPPGGTLTTGCFEDAAWEVLVKRVVNGVNGELSQLHFLRFMILCTVFVCGFFRGCGRPGHIYKCMSLSPGACRKGRGGSAMLFAFRFWHSACFLSSKGAHA